MPILADLKDQLNEKTKELEQKSEPWQRGLLIIALILFLIFSIYQLTKSDSKLSSKKEAQAEERLMRQMAFFKRLKE